MYKKKKLARKKHRKNQLRLKAKIQESLLKAKPKAKKVIIPEVESVQVETPVEETPVEETVVKKAPAKKKPAAKKKD